MARRTNIFLVGAVVLLLALGIVMLASASYYTKEGGGEHYYTVKRQLIWIAIGVLCGAGCCLLPYQRLMEWRWYLFGASVIGLALCFVPNVGDRVNGSSRWIGFDLIGIHGLRVQPSEFAKIAVAVLLAGYYARNELHTRSFLRGFMLPLSLLLVVVGLIGGEMDLGSAIITFSLGSCLMFIAGAKMRYMPLLAVFAVISVGLAIKFTPNRMHRAKAFASQVPFLSKYIDLSTLTDQQRKELEDSNRQQIHSAYAFGSGGTEGVGPGRGRMVMYSLPEAHTDFVLPMAGEEFGLRGTLLIVFSFVVILISGMCISCYAPDRFGKLLGFGLSALFGLEGLMNMGVTTGILPNKGLPLPFVSYGGTSLVMAMVSIGILCNIHRQGVHLTLADLPNINRNKRWTPKLDQEIVAIEAEAEAV
jgi:cell division protein FtsW